MKKKKSRIVREKVGGEWYEYVPLGEHVVAAPGVCGGRPTFKYTRLEVAVILDLIAAGRSVEQVLEQYPYSDISKESVQEAIQVAKNALMHSVQEVDSVRAAA